MIKIVDNLLNKITMYKIVLYYLIALWIIALVFSILGFLPYTPQSIVISLIIILASAWATNNIFSRIFKVPANVESIYISVFILALIISPALTPKEYIFLGWAGIIAMASKYIIAIKHKHLFNPAAFAVVITGLFINQYASWWIGTLAMTPFVLAGGLMVVRKLKRKDLALSFFIVAIVTIISFNFLNNENLFVTLWKTLVASPVLFFTFIMITEPLTTPPSRFLRILYGSLVGLLFLPQIHLGIIYITPEIALLLGNVFSYLISPKQRLTLKFKQANIIAPNTGEFIFEPDMPFSFKAGQYLEWTLGHDGVDSRGNRRYFTIASSPTERNLLLGIKFYEEPSSFKKAIAKMDVGEIIIASQLSGDFILPRDTKKKLVFVAGGIGITPFRSMIKYLIDKKEQRDIILIYANKTEEDIVYKNILDEAVISFNLKVLYLINEIRDKKLVWTGKIGHITEKMIEEEIKDFKERTFYISGPPSMVAGIEKVIKNLGINKIKTDFFPGFN